MPASLDQKVKRRKKKKKSGTGLLIALIVILALLLAFMTGILFFEDELKAILTVSTDRPVQIPTETTSAVSTEQQDFQIELPTIQAEAVTEASTEAITEPTIPEPPHIVSTASILSTGDLLMHSQLITDAKISGTSDYDFSYIFPMITDYVSQADYAVANLETTLGGSSKTYQGNPMFNCPDAIASAAKEAGFDMLLTANNHSYDSGQSGYERTLKTLRGMGLETLGTMLNANEPKYTIVEINGIRIGMVCFTYEDSTGKTAYPYLNYNPMTGGSYDIINCFRQSDTESLYLKAQAYLEGMKADGADATIFYIHWGQEYQLQPNSTQTAIAQKLCDLGYDVIIGGHPHVIQPLKLLTSTVDSSHKSICLYSTGNAVSNQRLGLISRISSAHTEDGILFTVTFARYSDGSVYVEDAEVIPTWVRAIDINGNTVVRQSATITKYVILPLDGSTKDSWQSIFGINDSTLQQCNESWQRTMDLTGSGLTDIRDSIAADKLQRETDFLAQFTEPEDTEEET